ncbi:HEPN domain-containing protein [Bacteroides neonati]|uniref:HEPN domain-containing protein n=1 Tax=Bacteroides neonati TaxID=1347393 RepID=UPI000945243F|nr:HEPN domain-containing protein [Bacteroides neonati]
MNELYDKSEINLEAAEKLHQAGLYDSVCHPSYYSCLQLMSHKLIRKGVSLSTQGTISSSTYHGSSHKCLIYETCKFLSFEGVRDRQNYTNNIKQLKEKRENADYHEKRISHDQSKECIRLAKEIRSKINSI